MLAMGGISLGKAVEMSGLLHEITRGLVPFLAPMSPYACFAIITGIIGVATTFVSHTVGALIILPIVKQVGAGLPTPMSRTLVMGAGILNMFNLGSVDV
jgi:phosphate transporter